MVDCSEWERYDFRDLEKMILLAKNDTKYVFIQDCHGEAASFFRYKGRLI